MGRYKTKSSSRDTGARINRGRWTAREKRVFEEGFKKHGKEWKLIASMIKTRTVIQIRTHAQKYFQKLAKQTGGPVMSTSKKEKLPEPLATADLRESVIAIERTTSNSSVGSAFSEVDTEPDTQEVTISLRRKRKNPPRSARKQKKTKVAEEEDEGVSVFDEEESLGSSFAEFSDLEEDCIVTEQLRLLSQSIGPDSGRITPGMLAAATLLVAPRWTDRISAKSLLWAQKTVLQKIY